MEIRVIVDLSEEIFDKYAELKTKRKLTSRVQDAITSFETEDTSNTNEITIDRFNRLEDAIIEMTKSVGSLISYQDKERNSRDDILKEMNTRMDNQDKILGSLLNGSVDTKTSMNDISVGNKEINQPVLNEEIIQPILDEEVIQPIVNKETVVSVDKEIINEELLEPEFQEVEKIVQVQSTVNNDSELSDLQKKLDMLREIERLTNAVNSGGTTNVPNTVSVEILEEPTRSAPSKNVRKKISNMMDI